MRSRIIIIFIGMMIAWGAVVMRAAQLQILPSARLKDLQRRQYKTLIELPARRGLITDRYGKELAVTIPAYSLYADPKEIDQPKRFARLIGKKLGMSQHYVYNKIKNSDRRFIWLKRRLNKEFVDGVKALKLRGLGVIEETERVYPNETLLAQVMGFVGQDGLGLEGLELKYDSVLKGEGRKIRVERDARGRPLLVDGKVFTDAPLGYDLVLTVDHELQYQLEYELNRAKIEHNADSAVGIVLDVQTSAIMAMGNVPAFDGNQPFKYNSEVWRNRGITDAFEPGSILKTLVVAGALRENKTKPNKKYFCENGELKMGRHIIHEAEVDHKFGWLTTSEILMLSSNIGTTKIALELGDKKLREILSDFGLGDQLGVDLPGEVGGVLKSLPWHEHLLSNISFGQGITATPLQMAAAYAAIANGGMLRRPYILQSQINPETGERIEYKAQDIRRVLSPELAATMRLMLNAATSAQGTGKLAQVLGYPIAGKTGTAQKVVVGQGYVKGQYISSFVGFIPVNNPRFVIFIAVDNPRNKYYGSEVAAPLFSRIASYAIRRAGVSPILISEKNMIKKSKFTEAEQLHEDSVNHIREMAKVLSAEEHNKVPEFNGLTLREVYNRVRGSPLKVDIHGEGTVSLSVPEAGHPLPENKIIKLYFSR